jgi:MFS family permease
MAFSAGFLIGPIWGGFVSERAGWNGMVTSLASLALFSVFPIVMYTGGAMRWRKRDMRKRVKDNGVDGQPCADFEATVERKEWSTFLQIARRWVDKRLQFITHEDE